MPIPNEYKEIIAGLIEATDAGRVHWDASRYGISVKISNALLEIWAGEDSESDKSFVTCSLREPGGQKATPLDSWFVEDGDPDYMKMRTFYQNARRQGLGIPQKLSAITEAIKSAKEIGEKKPWDGDDELPF